MKVAYVGLGSMGAPQARLIARSGRELAVYDPFPAALEAFRGIARLAGSAADAAREAEIACVCVRDDRQVEDVVLGEAGLAEGLASGALVLIHSTIRIDTLHRLKDALAPRGIGVVDAPVSRTRPTDDEAFVFTMLGGDAADVARARPIVETFSTDLDHIGPFGAGMATKIANNLVAWTEIVVGVQAFNLAARHGVPYDKLRAVMKANGNLTPTMQAMLDRKREGAHQELFVSQAGNGEKDLGLACECGQAAGLNMAMAGEARAIVRTAMTEPLAEAGR
jgi:3-hydroxyisobutyrate dehydrogenase